jgi:hypothetical protein
VAPDELWAAFSTVTAIRGDLVIENSPSLTSMLMFIRLERVNAVRLVNNPNLVDARMPSLRSFRGAVVLGSPYLCSAYELQLDTQAVQHSSDCNTLEVVQYFSVQPSSEPAVFITALRGVFTDSGLSETKVRGINSSSCLLSHIAGGCRECP